MIDGADRTLSSPALALTTDAGAALAGAGIVLVTVKSGATADMAGLIARHAPAEAIVVHQVTNGGKVMPKFKGTLSPKQIQDVAAYVYASTHS